MNGKKKMIGMNLQWNYRQGIVIKKIRYSLLEIKKDNLPLQSQNKRRVGQGVKTPPFHGGITGSIPVRATQGEKVSIFKHFFTFFFSPLCINHLKLFLKD